MGDMGDLYNDLREDRRKRRAELGIDCPKCRIKQPKRTPSILLPGQRCKVDGYIDPRPRAPASIPDTSHDPSGVISEPSGNNEMQGRLPRGEEVVPDNLSPHHSALGDSK